MSKKDRNYFNVTILLFDWAKTWELVGIHVLKKLSEIVEKENIGL